MDAGKNRLGTKIYRIIAGTAAREFKRFNGVRGVYIGGGLARDDILFGRSDIDLAILIDQFDDPREETRLIYKLSKAYRKLKKWLPVLGDAWVYNLTDMIRWYSYRNYRYIADGRLAHLCGDKIKLPEFDLKTEDVIYEIYMLMLFFLPMSLRSRNVKGSINIFLTVSMLYNYLTGKPNRVDLSKPEIIEFLISANPKSGELRRIRQAFSSFFVGRHSDLKKWAYKQCLILGDKLGNATPEKLEGGIKTTEIDSLFCPSFTPRRYLILDSLDEKDMENGLQIMGKDPGLVLTTTNILKMYLYYCYPWEYYTIREKNPLFRLSEPPSYYMKRYLKMQIIKHEIRFLNNYYLLLWDVRNLVAQAKLYFNHDIICVNKRDLVQKYKSRYGIWPYTESTSLETYLKHDYAILWDTIEGLCAQY